MNTKTHMVIIKGEIRTSEVQSCQYDHLTNKWDVTFCKGKTYSYSCENIECLKNPVALNPHMYRFSRNGRELLGIETACFFRGRCNTYCHICFENGQERDYLQNELTVAESCLNQSQTKDVFEYIRQIAGLSDIRNEETGEKILAKRLAKITFVGKDTALAGYLAPSLRKKKAEKEYIPVFPFGCNNSQYTAVKNAMENQISVIQGPPGTGKTQTILNIIANILMQGKTVQIVSNNNAAIENVLEKLSSPRYAMGFIVAALGRSQNKKAFIEGQSAAYPDISSWKLDEEHRILLRDIQAKSAELKTIFDKQEELADLKQEHAQLATEFVYFKQYVEETAAHMNGIDAKKRLSSKDWMTLWQECQIISEEKSQIGLFFKLKSLLRYGFWNRSFYKQELSKIIMSFQKMYYDVREKELSEKISEIEGYLKGVSSHLSEDLCDQSMLLFPCCGFGRMAAAKRKK